MMNNVTACCGNIVSADPVLSVASIKHDQFGWVVGGGVDTKLLGNWTAKIEYLYLDLGSQSEFIIFDGGPTPFHGMTVDFHSHIARAGLNYHL
jgi:outer membrane immunogenic protein